VDVPVIDQAKVRREKMKLVSTLQKEAAAQKSPIKGLYFDGRKDQTLVREKIGTKYHSRITKEEHVVLLQEPGSKYIGHIAPPSGQGRAIAKSIVEFLEEKEEDTSQTSAVGCDGTSANTGRKDGSVAWLEKYFGKELQHLVCLPHINELPLRHLLKKLDGETTGPSTFSGPVGRKLEGCENRQAVSFQAIQVPWVHELGDFNDLSVDQQYLLDICRAVSSGKCPEELANKKPGPISQSRWLTTACRILRLYLSTDKPSKPLSYLAEFVIRVYAPMWFLIKLQPACSDEARHVWKMIHLIKFLPNDLEQAIRCVIQHNAYFLHPENLILSMVTDPRKEIRTLGWRRIKKCRARARKGLREFLVPKINFEANDYVELIDWTSTNVTEPPLTKYLSHDELEDNIMTAKMAGEEITAFPSHTQAVERHVRVVTEAAKAVYGAENRDGYIKAKLKSRKEMPKFNSKKDHPL